MDPRVFADRSAPAACSDACDGALALVIADGERASSLARSALAGATDASTAALARAIVAFVELREGSLEAGRRELEAVRASAVPAGDRARLLACHAEALVLRREGRLPEAESVLRELHDKAPERPAVDAYLTASALGIVVSMRGRSDEALDCFYEALALARRSDNDSLLANALSNLGSYQADLGNVEDARPLLEEAFEGALRLDSRRQVIFAAGNLMQCLCALGEPARALALAREHLLPRIRADDPPALQRDEEIAQVLLDNGLVDEAQAMLAKAVQVDPLTNELATNRVVLLARIHLARGDAATAMRLCGERGERLRADGEEGTVIVDRLNLLRVAARAAHELGDDRTAYERMQEAYEAQDRLAGVAARARRASLQIVHRFRQAEWERDTANRLAGGLASLNESLQAQVRENERLQERLRAQALEDPLTELPNRRHLLDAGPALLALMSRRDEPVAAAMIDLDHFKRVNDRFGHETGDRVLVRFARLAQQALRAGDLVARYGGEEFVLLLPGADLPQAAARVASLLERFSGLAFEDPEGRAFVCTFSAGVAAWRGGGERLEPLLLRADEALYEAKGAGRARVMCEAGSGATLP